MEQLVKLGVSGRFAGTFLGHKLKFVEGKLEKHNDFTYNRIVEMFEFLNKQKLQPSIAKMMLPTIYQHPNMDFNSVLTSLNFKRRTKEEMLAPIDYLLEKFREIRVSKSDSPKIALNWVMGQLNRQALGNVDLKDLQKRIEKKLEKQA